MKITGLLKQMELKTVVKRLNEFANASLAADWDNVGLLVEPSGKLLVERILITNDLTEPVFEEALKLKSNMIISYHPPIFSPLKRLTQSQWKERLMVKCIENRIAVYSPHTSWDAIEGGINEWLLKPFGN
jgi:putative NIF3 family GTP cyclohydrolase 1 type 2